MTDHDHTTLVAGCYRCELNRDETTPSVLRSEQDCWNTVQDAGHLAHNGWTVSATEPLTCACGTVLGPVLTDPQQETYEHQAQVLVQIVEEYEATHPKGAPCFSDALESMRQRAAS